ncbi:hypothetical protein [Modestobacter lacusdianchii]
MTSDQRAVVNGAAAPRTADEKHEARIAFEVREELEMVRSELRARIEADRLRELELVAARRDMEVKSAYNVMLERSLTERQEHLDWARNHIDHLDRIAQVDLPAAIARAEHAESQVAGLVAELAAERGRASSRAVQYWVDRLNRRRILFRIARRVAKRLHPSPRA